VKPAITTLMYLTNRPDSIASFREHAAQISIIAPQTFVMDAEGFISGDVPDEVLQIAASKRVAVLPLVVNRRFDQPLMHTVLDSPESRQRAIRYLLYYALRDGYLGFQFDYENIHHTYRDRFSAFFREAAAAFHQHGLVLSAAVVGRYADDPKSESPGGFENWSGVYDYGVLGKYADFLTIMAYPQHAQFSGPGPVAGIPWVRRIADYSSAQLPARKISLGVPLYGVQWTAQPASPTDSSTKWKARSARYPDISARFASASPVWDEAEQSPHLMFIDQGGQAELWYEDARSLAAKLDLARSSNFAGVSGWSLGSEDPGFWTALTNYPVAHPPIRVVKGTLEQRAIAAARALSQKPPAVPTTAAMPGAPRKGSSPAPDF
jgi:spore germination protein YaaH